MKMSSLLPRSLKSVTAAALIAITASIGATPTGVEAQSQPGWLRRLNTIRAESGLDPVTINSAWQQGVDRHSCYLTWNGLKEREVPGSPFWSHDGLLASMSTIKLAHAETDPVNFINSWFSSPYQTLKMLKPGWAETAYADCEPSFSGGDRRTKAVLDTDNGIKYTTVRNPILYPGNNATTPLTHYAKEGTDFGDWVPNPQEPCGIRGRSGLPIVAILPTVFYTKPNVKVTGPNGPVATCDLYKEMPGLGAEHKQYIGRNAVVIMPRTELQRGTHNVTVTAGGQTVNWKFHVISKSGGGGGGGNTPSATCAGKVATIVGTEGNDTLTGTNGPDVIHGLGGNDFITGRDGNDIICGGAGNDTVYSGPGADKVWGAVGDDKVWGGKANDMLDGGAGSDRLNGQLGNDVLKGGAAGDNLIGGAGDDNIYGAPGSDRIIGGDGRDKVWGGKDNDVIQGNRGRDTLYGELGTDNIDGGADNDICRGERLRGCER